MFNTFKNLFRTKKVEDRTYPQFKYHPNAYEIGIFEKESTICEVCNQHTDLVYTGNFYSRSSIEKICPFCIANGKAAKIYSGSYQEEYERIENSAAEEAILKRTPSYTSWQGNRWLAHCNDYCQFIGYVGWKEIKDLGIEEEIRQDIKESGYGLEPEVVQENLFNDGDLQGYLFKCIHCNKYRLYYDMS